MKDRSVLITWCAGMGALLVVVLLIRSSVNQSPASVQSPPDRSTLDIETIPIPPPPGFPTEPPQTRLEQDLIRQQELTEALKDELEQQQDLADDLKHQLERQRQENERITAQLKDYQDSVETMTAQQARLIESIPQNNQTQTMLLWGIVGLFAMLLLGGGVALIIFALWMMQIQRQGRRPTVVYPMRMPYDPYYYQGRQTLPPPPYGQPFVQYDVRPLDD